jgi:hypothetical protein
MESILHLNNITKEDFLRKYFNKIPFVLKGGALKTRYFNVWTPEYLKRHVGSKTVAVSHSQSGLYNVTIAEQFQNVNMAFGEALDLFITQHKAYYLFKASIFDHFPELLEDVEIPEFIDTAYDKIVGINLWTGGQGCVTHLHYDTDHNFLVQVRGRKEVTLFSPDDTRYLYFKKRSNSHVSEVNIDNVDEARFPLYKNATPLPCVLEPGDILYMPPVWWHQVKSLDMCININFWWDRFDILDGMGAADYDVDRLCKQIRTFINMGFSIEHCDPDGEPLIVKAVAKGYSNVVEAFLMMGASPNLKSTTYRPGVSALDIALESGNKDIVRLLTEYSAENRSVVVATN